MTITMADIKREKRNIQKRELAEIEAKLHCYPTPSGCPTINGCEILHRHVGQKIIFEAWKGDDPVQPLGSRRYSEFSRTHVLYVADFYKTHAEDLQWLTES